MRAIGMIPVAPVCRGGTMRANELVVELGVKLGIPLRLSEAGTCRVTFDDDDVDFEQSGDALYIMAEIASAAGREDACGRLLTANWLGAESGGACIGLDAERNAFALYAVERGDVSYEEFEARLTLFIRALRYWKEWLAQPLASSSASPAMETFSAGMIRI